MAADRTTIRPAQAGGRVGHCAAPDVAGPADSLRKWFEVAIVGIHAHGLAVVAASFKPFHLIPDRDWALIDRIE